MDSVTFEVRAWGIWATRNGRDLGWCGRPGPGDKAIRWWTQEVAEELAAVWNERSGATRYEVRVMPAGVLPHAR